MALNDRQTLFVEEYLRTFNATKAALSAGYSPRSACEIGWENLRKPQIAEVIKQRLAESAMSADEVLMRLADIARGDISDLLTVDGNNIRIDLDKAMAAQAKISVLDARRIDQLSQQRAKALIDVERQKWQMSQQAQPVEQDDWWTVDPNDSEDAWQ